MRKENKWKKQSNGYGIMSSKIELFIGEGYRIALTGCNAKAKETMFLSQESQDDGCRIRNAEGNTERR